MCGIVGAFGPRASDRDLVRRMAASIRHRGPDDTGEFFTEGAGLVMNRLAIIDLAGGNQPLFSPDRRTVLIYNGEIYNFRELRAQLEGRHRFTTHSDTEVILHGYAEWGLDVFAKLDGIFAVALLDQARERLVLARDPLGTKPLYLLEGADTLFFASELKSFTDNRLATRVDLAGVFQFLAAGYVFGPHTALEGARQLEPGHYAIATRAGVAEERRFRSSPPPAVQSPPRDRAQWRDATRDALARAVVGQTVADVPYGLLLSSGLDSMAMLCTLKDRGLVENLDTFTITYEEASFDEGPAVAALARKWGFRNTQMALTSDVLRESLDDVFHTFDNLELFPTSVAIYSASRLAGGRMKVLLAGNGGDELFGGYPTYRATELVQSLGFLARLIGRLDTVASRIPASGGYLTWTEKLRRFVAGCRYHPEMVHFLWRHLFLPDEIAALAAGAPAQVPAPEALYAPQTRFDAEAAEMGYAGLARLSYADMKGWLVDHGLSMWDKAGMRWSAEIRVPLVDPDFVDFVFGIPAEVRMRPAGSKAFLREVLADRVPPEILALPKHGFQVPIGEWLRGPLRAQFQALSLSLPESCFSRSRIERLWSDFLERGVDNALKLWTLGSLSGWASRHRLSWP